MLTMVGVRSYQVSESFSKGKWGLKTAEFSPEVPIFKVILTSYMLTMVGVRSDQVSESFSKGKWGLKTA